MLESWGIDGVVGESSNRTARRGENHRAGRRVTQEARLATEHRAYLAATGLGHGAEPWQTHATNRSYARENGCTLVRHHGVHPVCRCGTASTAGRVSARCGRLALSAPIRSC